MAASGRSHPNGLGKYRALRNRRRGTVVEIAVVYIILVILVAAWAGQWGRSAGGFGLLALVISPLLAAIVLLIMGRGEVGPSLSEYPTLTCSNCGKVVSPVWKRRCEHCKMSFDLAPPIGRPPPPEPVRADPTTAIESLASLRDRGVITDEEFQAKKSELLARL